eukprot:5751430-Pyramimonas_sp.AAC.1
MDMVVVPWVVLKCPGDPSSWMNGNALSAPSPPLFLSRVSCCFGVFASCTYHIRYPGYTMPA